MHLPPPAGPHAIARRPFSYSCLMIALSRWRKKGKGTTKKGEETTIMRSTRRAALLLLVVRAHWRHSICVVDLQWHLWKAKAWEKKKKGTKKEGQKPLKSNEMNKASRMRTKKKKRVRDTDLASMQLWHTLVLVSLSIYARHHLPILLMTSRWNVTQGKNIPSKTLFTIYLFSVSVSLVSASKQFSSQKACLPQ